MKSPLIWATTSACCVAIVFAVMLGGAPVVQAKPAAFEIDAGHSSVGFKIKHAGVSYAHGRFNDISGSFSLDGDNAAGCSISVTIKSDSVDTNDAKRDGHLKSPDFFNCAQYPTITFKSTAVAATTSKTHFDVTGDLTLHGVKKSVRARVEKVGEANLGDRFGYRAGFEGTLQIKRSDFGMKEMLNMIGDEVTITLSFEGLRQ
jgi:polyisoprenoid-binding protein YceI